MKHNIVDYIIIGGGCSALSFASEIIKNNIENVTFLIIEGRKKYEDDRSWCFWDKRQNNNKKIISKSWKDFSVSFSNQKVVHCSRNYSYHYIRSLDFYSHAIDSIKKSKNIDFVLNEKVKKILNRKNKFLVYTNKNNYLAKNILDTRPKKNIFMKTPFLYQSFLGYEITIPSEKYLFRSAGLMENMRYEKDKFLFDYILPLNKNTILLEVTSFSNYKLSVEALTLLLKESLSKNNLFTFKLKRKEYGVIPMGFIKKNALPINKNYYYAGSLGGAVRPSSGYAFLRIQQWAKLSALSLKKNGRIISHPRDNVIVYFFDKIFLNVLQKNLSSAPFIFFVFLKRINTNSFIRFMTGDAKLIDYLRVIFAMPKKYFLNKSLWK